MNQSVMAFFFGTLALAVGSLVNYFGDALLGVRLEFYVGVYTFSPVWIVDLFLVPFFAGIAVSMVYGLGGKLLCYFVPLIVRSYSYIDAVWGSGVPEGASLLPFPYWVLVLIVAIESAAFGGVAGEILVKKTYGRRPRHLVYKDNKSDGQ
jgi:hypothetical protein